jgi:hypothetical protein
MRPAYSDYPKGQKEGCLVVKVVLSYMYVWQGMYGWEVLVELSFLPC